MGIRGYVRDVARAVNFLSRLPLPQTDPVGGSLASTLRAAPLAGVLIAAGPALLVWAASWIALPSFAAAALGVGAMIAVTGGLHEDGLADAADGFGGGATLSRKLAIMRDSRIGTYGTLAIGVSLLLRVSALQGLIDRTGAGGGAFALLGAAALSRGLMLLPLALLKPARSDGLAHAAAPKGHLVLAAALVAGCLLGAVLAIPVVPNGLQILAALVGGGAAALGTTRLARHQIGGVTGDVIGATQQAVEIVYLLTLCGAAGSH